jgi:hypothetical protein
MTAETKKAKADPTPKSVPAEKSETATKEPSAPAQAVAKTEGGETAAAAPSNYSRGEGQKPVSAAYKENWNAIFANKKATGKKTPEKNATKTKATKTKATKAKAAVRNAAKKGKKPKR